MYKILIVDDHEVVRLGLKNYLAQDKRLSAIDEADNAKDSIKKAKNNFYDVIIMDARLPDKSGIEACKEILTNCPETNVMILSAYSDEEMLIEAILAGASGYLLKEVRMDSLAETVVKAAQGVSILDARTTEKVMDHLRSRRFKDDDKLAKKLTPKECNILELVARGKTNKEIGRKLYVSEKTVRNQLSKILNKLRLHNRAEAAAFYASELKNKQTHK